MVSRRRMTALALSSWTAAAAMLLAALAPGQAWLRLPLGLPLVAFLPGYALVRALSPRPARDPLARAVISVGASLAITVFLGLALNLTAEGLGTASWMIALGAWTLVLNAATLAREKDGAVPLAPRRRVPRPGLAVAAVLAATVAVLSVVVSARYAFYPASGEVIQLWALPEPGRPDDIRVGVSNRISGAERFHLRILHADSVLADKPLYLSEGKSIVFSVRLPAEASRLTPVRAVLTSEDPPTERSVTLWPRAVTPATAAAGR